MDQYYVVEVPAKKSFNSKWIAWHCQKMKVKKTRLFLFSSCPPPGLVPVLGPLGSGTDATHLLSPALRLKGWCWSWVELQVLRCFHFWAIDIPYPSGIWSTAHRRYIIYCLKNWRLYEPSHHGWTVLSFIYTQIIRHTGHHFKIRGL